MLDRELNAVISTIEAGRNPEIHHYNRGSHPGLGWYIKTVSPGPDIITDETFMIHQFWKRVSGNHPRLVRLVDSAYDWSGTPIRGWWTVWLNDRIDVKWQYDPSDGFDYHIVDYDQGLKSSAKNMREIIDGLLRSRPTDDNSVSYERLAEIVEFLRTYTTDQRSKQNRAKLRIIADDQIHIETTD